MLGKKVSARGFHLKTENLVHLENKMPLCTEAKQQRFQFVASNEYT